MNTEQTQEPYMIDSAGRLFRKGEEIGKLEGDKLTLKPEAKNYQASVTRWLREKADEEEAKALRAKLKDAGKTFGPRTTIEKLREMAAALPGE